MTVLVTGGTGVMGSWVVRELVERGVRPVVYDVKPDLRLLADVADRLTFVHGDVTNLPLIIEIAQQYGVERIIHLAAVLGSWARSHPQIIFTANGQGTMNILEAAKLCRIRRVIMGSSKGVLTTVAGTRYGHPTYAPIPPTAVGPRNAVGIIKLAMEQMGALYMAQGHFEFAAIRFGDFYCMERLIKAGYSRSVANVLTDIIIDAYTGRTTRIARGGDQKFDPIYVADCARGVVDACFAPQLRHPVYHLGSGRAVSLREAAAVVQRTLPGARMEIGPGLDFADPRDDANFCVLDTESARDDLGFQLRYDLPAGIAACGERLQWLRAQGIAPAESVTK